MVRGVALTTAMAATGCRIVLCGANSVGKTTLADDWQKKHQEYRYLVEVARDVMIKNSITGQDVRESVGDKPVLVRLQNLIFEEQNRQEIALGDCKAVIIDRGPDPLAFMCQLKSKAAADELSTAPAAVACLERYRSCLVVVVGLLPTEPEHDGLRMVQERDEQEEFTEILCSQLEKNGISYRHLKETDRERRVLELETLVKGSYIKSY